MRGRGRSTTGLGCSCPNRPDLLEILADLSLRDLNVVIGLKIQPEFGRGAEDLRQAQRGICRYARFLIRQSLDARPRNATGAFATAPGDSPSGNKNSSRRTSPGCRGASLFNRVR